MDISKRLKTIANYVPVGTNCVVDIGTDHGYIPIYLIKNKIAKKCIACDINPLPLNNAKANIASYGLSDQIETRLSNGLAKINMGEADAIIIAGMGGMLIINILEEKKALVKAVGLLILQAQLDIVEVRRYIHSINFTIIDEQMVYEDDQYYTIIKAQPGYEKPYSTIGYLFGQKNIDKKEPILKQLIGSEIQRLNLLDKNIAKNKTRQAQKRLSEIREEIATYKEVYECL